MEPVVTNCVGCGKAIRIRRPDVERRRVCPVCATPLPRLILRPATPEARSSPAIPTSAARSRRAFVGASGLLELTTFLMLAAPIAVWSTAAWTSAASPAPPSRTTSTPALLRTASAASEPRPELGPRPATSAPIEDLAPIESVLNLRRAAVAMSGSFPISSAEFGKALGAFRMAARSAPPWVHAIQHLAFRAPEPDDLSSKSTPSATALLTPPDFGANASETMAAARSIPEERRFLVRTEDGRQVVARLHGHHEGKSFLMLPDGWLGIPSMLVPTDEPFQPMTADEMAKGLQTGPFAEFGLHRTEHYLILHQSPDAGFAISNGVLLEDLYRRLLEAFRKHEVTVHDAEFPLVAVIFRTEEDFRAYREVAPDVQAYYEIATNRILFYEHPSGEGPGPEVAALLKPQMVAHEGTHQILQNIGVQPRLSEWPAWLVEGLAEYCSTPASSRKGPPAWDGLGQINNLHMATLRELEDPVSLSMRGQDVHTKSLFRKPGQPLVEAMVRRRELTPTEYALAWSITHYLAMKRSDDFTRFLRIMAAVPPLEPRSADDHVREFREAFGDDLGKLDKTIHAYLNRLTKQKGYDPMPYYAVLFEQPLPNGRLRRAAMVSQSPQLIKQWIDEMSNPAAALASWQASPYPSRARATLAVQEWIHSQ